MNKYDIMRYIILAGAVIAAIVFIYTERVNETKEIMEKEYVYIKQFDTIISVIYKTDTIFPKNEIKYETKIINDTVYIKDEPHTTRDSNDVYTIDINAVKLNWYKLDIHAKDTIVKTNTIYDIKKNEPQRSKFYYGIGIGTGYGLITKKPDIFVGFNIGYRF